MITLGVEDLAAAVTFYEDGLGLPLMHATPEVAFFALSGSWLSLHPRAALAADADVSPEGSGFEGVTLSHNVASEAEVDAVMQEALDAGARQVRAPQPTEWGGYSGYFADLDGHLWEIAHNPHFWVGPKDD
jgi:hypothetical protein